MSDSEDPRTEERVGSVLDEKWTLERILGSGGMGAVYAGRHRNGARGAVKVLHPELARRSDVRERFLREGYAANRVEHRGAVRVLDDDIVKEGPDEGTAYLVMEMLEGESLEERLDRGPPLTELELLPILDDVLAVLEAAHEHGVVHRDLKPANLFLNKDPTGPGVKVLDFGLARLEEMGSMTGAGLALGTPSFMAPEQANGRSSEIDARTDLFAVGATAFKILAGRGVHEADGVLELVARMGTLPAPKLREVAPQVSEHVARVVDRALEFKREDRYPTAAAMRADVQSAQSRLSPPIPAVVAPVALAAGSPVAAAHVAVAPVPAASPVAAALEDTRLDALAAHASARSEVARPPARRGVFAPIVVVVLVAISLVIMLVPRLQERAGFAAMNDLWTSSPPGSALPPEPGAVTPPEPASPPPDPEPASASASTLADADAADADSADASEMADAAVDEDDASTSSALIDLDSGALLDASADASDDEDDDEEEDDPDAAAPAPVATRSTASVAPRPTVVKRPRPRPRPPSKHGRPRKKRRPRR